MYGGADDQAVLTWVKTLGPLVVWVSGPASHFKSHVMRALGKALKLDRRSVVASSPWSNDNYEEQYMEIFLAMKVLLQEERRDLGEQVGLVPAMQRAFITAF